MPAQQKSYLCIKSPKRNYTLLKKCNTAKNVYFTTNGYLYKWKYYIIIICIYSLQA